MIINDDCQLSVAWCQSNQEENRRFDNSGLSGKRQGQCQLVQVSGMIGRIKFINGFIILTGVALQDPNGVMVKLLQGEESSHTNYCICFLYESLICYIWLHGLTGLSLFVHLALASPEKKNSTYLPIQIVKNLQRVQILAYAFRIPLVALKWGGWNLRFYSLEMRCNQLEV